MRRLLNRLFVFASVWAFMQTTMAQESPNGRLTVQLKDHGLVLASESRHVLDLPIVGVEGASACTQLTFIGKVKADYTMLAGKRSHCVNEAKEYQAELGQGVRMVLRLYNDGLAFRYELSGLTGKVPAELTSYRIAEGTKRWMQVWSDGYEGFFPLTTTATDKADGTGRWGYPALLEPVDGLFALISEANIERRQSASCLFSQGEVYRVVPDKNDVSITGEWHTPWRVVMVGTLAEVVQSTLITDVSEPSQVTDTEWIHPGVVSWVYWAYNHGSNDYNIICKYVNLANVLRLPYVLIDAEWDEMKDGKTIEDAVNYAKAKGVKPMIWYNSSVGWIDGAPTPKFRLNKPEDREREFAWCERLGVAGVKIDFFSGDNQMNMDYCLDLLESAARHHLLVNFHGATIPRGWQRTWPNLLSTEGVYGAEWYNNVATFTTRAARHNATLPFTRNVIGPMDYTPCAFSDSQHPHITTHAHELALTVVFESGLQHLADRPESFLAQPKAVQRFLGHLPAAWDETRLLSGYPGEGVVIARRSGTTWYVAGINGRDEVQTLEMGPLKEILSSASKGTMTMFADSGNASEPWAISKLSEIPASVTCQPRGGFVMVVRQPEPIRSRVIEEGGTGAYKALMTEVDGLEEHTVFLPKDLTHFGSSRKLPVLVWGNGACANSPFEHAKFLNEIASYGYLVIATGEIPMTDDWYHGPMSTTQQQIESIDWAYAQNADPNSPLYQKLDLAHLCLAGMSCGGLQSLYNCAELRISSLMICNSGLFNMQNASQAKGGMPMPSKEKLKDIHTPVLYLLGGKPDIAYENGMDDFHRINHVPAYAANLPVGHGGTYLQPHGGEFAVVARAWLDWQLKGDRTAARFFTGKHPRLAQRQGWTLEKNAKAK